MLKSNNKQTVYFTLVVFFYLLFYGFSAYAAETNEEIVFDCYHVNWAWGYQLSGLYINNKGSIYKYNRNNNPWTPTATTPACDTDGQEQCSQTAIYTEAELLDKFKNAELIGEISETVLSEYMTLIPAAAEGYLTKSGSMGADFGSQSCNAYLFDPTKKIYTEVRLGSYGDYTEKNSSVQSLELHNWLQSHQLVSAQEEKCNAVYDNGILHIPCIKVRESSFSMRNYEANLQYKPGSETMTFELIRAIKDNQ